jgi:hypothetical protein
LPPPPNRASDAKDQAEVVPFTQSPNTLNGVQPTSREEENQAVRLGELSDHQVGPSRSQGWRWGLTSTECQAPGTQTSQGLLHFEGPNNFRELEAIRESTAVITHARPELDLNASSASRSVSMAIVNRTRGDGLGPTHGFQFGAEYRAEGALFSTRSPPRSRLHSHRELAVYSGWLTG